MAEVFKAHPAKAPGKLLAIKRILPQFSQNKDLVSMLIKEASVSVSLQHPNIVTTFDFGMIAGTYFLAMEYVQGKDLKSVIQKAKEKRTEIPHHLAVHIAIHVLRGLDYAHHKLDSYQRPLEIVHRDISPQNIMVNYNGQIKVLDFGIAKVSAKQDPSELGVLKGKFSYMSPEQAYGKPLDPRSDVYAAGILLWEMLTMQSCFDGKTDLDLLRSVRESKPRTPDSVNAKIPKELSAIVMKAISKKPSSRYDTAQDFADALEKFQHERFGKISEEDVSAFLRNYFKFDSSEIKETLFISESEGLSFQKLDPSNRSNPQIRAPWVQREKQKKTAWVYPTLILGAFALSAIFVKPVKLFKWFDQMCMRGVESVQGRLGFIPSEKKAKTIRLKTASSKLEKFKLMYSPKAQESLDDLPFETFDSVREAIGDLSMLSDPSHRLITNKLENPYMSVQNYKIEVIPNNMTQTLLVQNISTMTLPSTPTPHVNSKK